MAKKKKVKTFRKYKKCKLCGIESTQLGLTGFCRCVRMPSDMIQTEKTINGKLENFLMYNPEKIQEIKNRYISMLEEVGLLDWQILEKKENNTKRVEQKNKKKKLEFYNSWEWKEVRLKALKLYGRKCLACGATAKDSKICVDHIMPISRFWHKRLDLENLQTLCDDCNKGKSNKVYGDFRDSQDKKP